MANSTVELATPASTIVVSVDITREEMDDVSSLPPQYASNAMNLSNRASYIELVTNGLFKSRIMILLITIFLFLLSLSYAFGQILSVELSDFWCKTATITEIRDHSRQISSNYGSPGTCWSTDQSDVKNNDVYIFLFCNITYCLLLILKGEHRTFMEHQLI